jgi:hypothetical protein
MLPLTIQSLKEMGVTVKISVNQNYTTYVATDIKSDVCKATAHKTFVGTNRCTKEETLELSYKKVKKEKIQKSHIGIGVFRKNINSPREAEAEIFAHFTRTLYTYTPEEAKAAKIQELSNQLSIAQSPHIIEGITKEIINCANNDKKLYNIHVNVLHYDLTDDNSEEVHPTVATNLSIIVQAISPDKAIHMVEEYNEQIIKMTEHITNTINDGENTHLLTEITGCIEIGEFPTSPLTLEIQTEDIKNPDKGKWKVRLPDAVYPMEFEKSKNRQLLYPLIKIYGYDVNNHTLIPIDL